MITSMTGSMAGVALTVLACFPGAAGGQAVAGGKLAMRSKSETLIEVRGEGHYVLAPGSPRACHQTNVPYTFEAMGWLADA